MRAKSDLTDQSECGLPYSVFGGLAVNPCSLQLQTRHSQSCFDCCDSHLLGSQERTDEPLNATMRLWRRDLLLQWKFTAMLQGIRWAYMYGLNFIIRIRSMQPGARDRLTRATHRAQHPVLRAGAGVSSPSTLFYPPTIPLQQYLLKATINRGHGTRFVCVCVL